MEAMVARHGQRFTHLWKGIMGCKQTGSTPDPLFISLSEVEKLLCACGGLLYLGAEPLLATIPPAKLAALDLSGTVNPHASFSLHVFVWPGSCS